MAPWSHVSSGSFLLAVTGLSFSLFLKTLAGRRGTAWVSRTTSLGSDLGGVVLVAGPGSQALGGGLQVKAVSLRSHQRHYKDAPCQDPDLRAEDVFARFPAFRGPSCPALRGHWAPLTHRASSSALTSARAPSLAQRSRPSLGAGPWLSPWLSPGCSPPACRGWRFWRLVGLGRQTIEAQEQTVQTVRSWKEVGRFRDGNVRSWKEEKGEGCAGEVGGAERSCGGGVGSSRCLEGDLIKGIRGCASGTPAHQTYPGNVGFVLSGQTGADWEWRRDEGV